MASLHDKRGRGSPRPLLLVLLAMTCTAIAGYYCGRASVSSSSSLISTQELPKKSQTSAAAKKKCSEELSAWQKLQWESALQQRRLWLACPDHKWLEILADGWRQGNFTIFDIGCNKGYETAEFIQVFAPQLKLTNQHLFMELNRNTAQLKLPNRGLCGACLDCQKRPSKLTVPPDSKRSYLQLHCFEPSDSNIKLLNSVQSTLVPPHSHEKVQLRLFNLAMSDKVGVTEFPTECGEHCSLLMPNGKHKTFPVNVSTVDQHVKSHGIPFIDLLKIDTEGFDPLVLGGAKSVLAQQKVGAVLFEHHSLGIWKNTPLQAIMKRMEGYGYVCYYGGQPTLTRLTGCWNDAYNGKRWSNVVCILAAHPKFKEVNALSFLAQPSAPLF